ncbi:MAG TPA: hypothetical protein VHD87_05250 [Acidimicrobiales bacterium]|nr:hypothetical protein [Acidimicrobiales bacterium]
MKTRLLAASVALMLIGVTGAVFHTDRSTPVVAAPPRPTTTTSTSTTSTTLPPTTTTTAPPPPPAPVRAAAVTAPPTTLPPILRTNAPLVPGNPMAFAGFGAWVDVYDWSNEYTGGKPTVGPADVDRMAKLGVQTLYIQATKTKSQTMIVDPQLLHPLIDRAHADGMGVIAWYAPSFEDPLLDLRKMLAMHALGVEGIGVDIESRVVSDTAERNRRLVDLSVALRQHLPQVALAAVVMPAVQMEVVNPGFWPGFPYRDLAPAYDAWMPMDYWTSRTVASGYRDGYRYTAENIDRLRADLGNPNAYVHPVGGIGDASTEADVDGFHRAAAERNAIGGSVYDYHTTGDALWPHLAAFRR